MGYLANKLNIKVTLAIVIMAGIFAGFLSAMFVKAAGPVFNIFPITYGPAVNMDSPLLDVRNATRGEGWSTSQADHDAGVQANPGDVIEFSIYYHNGAPNDPANTAISTIVKAFTSPGLSTPASTHFFSATIQAQNSGPAWSAQRGGDVAVHIQGAPATMSLVPGSVQLFRDQGLPNRPGPQTLPDTILTSGVNIGDVSGCFEFHGFVNFKLQVASPPPPPTPGDFSVQKEVRNVSTNSGFDQNEVTAAPSQTAEFRITVTATGAPLDMRASDIMDSGLTLTGNVNRSNGPPLDPTGFFASVGEAIGQVSPGNPVIITYQAVVSASVNNASVLPNTAYAASPAEVKSDQAQVRISVPTQTRDLTITKSVRNVDDGTGFGSSVNADPGELVRFQITINTTGTGSQTNVTVQDSISDNRLVFMSGTLYVDNAPANSSAFFGSGLNLGAMNAGETRTIEFDFQVAAASSFSANVGIINTATVASSEVGNRSATATVNVVVTLSANRDLIIQKRVQNLDTASNFDSSVTASPGQLVRFEIVFTTTGNAGQTNVTLRDVISDTRLVYISGTLVIDESTQSDDPNLFGSAGRNFDNQAANATHTVLFDARVAGPSSFSTSIAVTNTATVSSSEVGNRSATATVNVSGVGGAMTRDLTITKQVQNFSDNTGFDSSVSADPGERVRFRIVITATGNASQTNVTVRDSISDSRLSLAPGTLFVSNTPANESAFFSGGVSMGNLLVGESRTIVFDANIGGSSFFSSNVTVTNTATTRSTEVSDRSAAATVNVNVNATGVNRDLNISKSVRNIDDNTNYTGSVNADPGERVRFRIVITATGSQTNVTVQDSISDNRLAVMSGTLYVDNAPANSSALFGSGLNLGGLNSGQTKTIEFDAQVAGSGSFGSSMTITNTARVQSAEVGERNSAASVNVSVSGGTSITRDLRINKRVMNITRGPSNFSDSVNAQPGDRLQFEIFIEAIGNASQNNITVRDTLPGNLSLFTSDTTIFNNGRNFGNLSPYTSRTITYEAVVASSTSFPAGVVTTLVNNARVTSDELGTRSDSVQVFVTGAGVAVAGVQFQQRKTAFNVTQGINAPSVAANPGDIIQYTLAFRNTGSSTMTGVRIEDEISDVLELAEITNQGGALSVDSLIRFAALDVAPGTEVARTFQVRVRDASLFPATSDLVMINVYGNEVRVPVRKPGVSGIAVSPPRTGPTDWLPGIFALVSTVGYWVIRKSKMTPTRGSESSRT